MLLQILTLKKVNQVANMDENVHHLDTVLVLGMLRTHNILSHSSSLQQLGHRKSRCPNISKELCVALHLISKHINMH